MSQTKPEVDWTKVEELTLALLHLTAFEEHGAVRAWKGHSWEALDRLHRRGWIEEEGTSRSRQLFQEHFELSGRGG